MGDSTRPDPTQAPYCEKLERRDRLSSSDFPSLVTMIDSWRYGLAQDITHYYQNPRQISRPTLSLQIEHCLSGQTFVSHGLWILDHVILNRMINRLIIRLLWLGLCENQGVISSGTLQHYSQQTRAYHHFKNQFHRLSGYGKDDPYLHWDHLAERAIRDVTLQPMLAQATQIPQVSAHPEALLGMTYEYVLAHPLPWSKTGGEQPGSSCPTNPQFTDSTRKPSGIYYTPSPIVDCIIQETLGRSITKKQSQSQEQEQLGVTILDPACGAGIFLVAAYRWLLQWSAHADRSVPPIPAHHLATQPQGQPPVVEESLTLLAKQAILQRHVYGVDLDYQAVEITRLSLLLVLWQDACLQDGPHHDSFTPIDLTSTIQWGNALMGSDIADDPDFALSADYRDRLHPMDWAIAFPEVIQQGGFDIVLGNPPYVDAEWMSRYQPIERRYYTKHYKTASGNWDLFCVFCEQALRLCKPNGLSSFIVPNKLAAADYAQATRTLLTVENQLLYLRDYSHIPVFSIAVYPLVYVVRKATPTGESVTWERPVPNQGAIASPSPFVSGLPLERQLLSYAAHFSTPQRPWAIAPTPTLQTLMAHLRHQGTPLATLAHVHGAATVAEAYAIKPMIREMDRAIAAADPFSSALQPTTFKFVNSGSIDPYQFLWGSKPLRYLKACYQTPIISMACVAQLLPKRLAQAHQAKIVVAGMTLGLECAVDLRGEYWAGKSTTIVTSALDLRYLAAILNSRLMSTYYRTEFGGNALSGGYLRIGPPQLKTLPIVVGCDRHQAIIIDLVDRLMTVIATATTADDGLVRRQAIAHQIDQQVYALYGLSEEAIAAINDG